MITPKKIEAKCDFCDSPAKYDGKTIYGPWAYMCERHRQFVGVADSRFINRLTTEEPAAPHKVCTACGKDKPLDAFYKYTDCRGKERYRNECKECNLFFRQQKRNSQKGETTNGES